jgi:hypothetical protein
VGRVFSLLSISSSTFGLGSFIEVEYISRGATYFYFLFRDERDADDETTCNFSTSFIDV